MQRSPTREHYGAITALYIVTLYIEILSVVDKYINLLLSYKPIRGSSGAMHSCMFLSTIDASLGRSAYFIFRLSAWPFLGSVNKVDPPPVYLLPRLARSASSHSCFFLQGVSQHLGYLLFMDSQPCPIWTIT